MTDPATEYALRVAKCDETIAQGERNHIRLGNVRLAIAAIGVGLVLFILGGSVSPWWAALPAAVLLALVILHERLLKRTARTRRVRQLYARGLGRVVGQWAGEGPDGARFLDGHPYARDLDLFGPASLFQLLDTARTEVGEETLAAWIGRGADLDEVRARQTAVDELRPKIEFREAIALLATDVKVGRTTALAAWARSSPAGLTSVAGWLFAGSGAMTALLGLSVVTGFVNYRVLVVWGVVQSALALWFQKRVRLTLGRVDLAVEDLALMSTLLARVEGETFTSARLCALHKGLITEGVMPSHAIRAITRLVGILDSCRNQMFLPVAMLLMIRSQVAVAIDQWHAVHGQAIARWLSAIGEIEALMALATYAYEHPADPFPTFVTEGPVFDAEGLSHPLMRSETAVRNDLRIGGPGCPRMFVVSGSNMSGKSTLLRAVGVNVVLALAGGPVRATRLLVSRVELGATLRIEDSLQAGISKFYAEILRIRTIVDVARGPIPLLFLLDEILGGTNSHDRRIGADAIVHALVNSGAIGLVTTHDLALTELTTTLGSAAVNVHFEDRIDDGKMVFDYRMRPGVVERSNALALMRAVGLDV